ncbi:MAG: class I SAM-dependent methyltransferase [Methylophilaceae bacterium]
MSFALNLAEKNLLPDWLIRIGIRKLLKDRIFEICSDSYENQQKNKIDFIHNMNRSPIAVDTNLANEQHYEVPSEFYDYALGKNKKYSSCYWNNKTETLDAAEQLALNKTCEHAELKNGHSILELGCGWGSLTLWMAKKYPKSKITAVSNSHSQRKYIENQAKQRKLANVKIITCNMTEFDTKSKFDRIVSVEMFEHMRNFAVLYQKISTWLKKDGKFFKHIFVHKSAPYLFKVKDKNDWMSQYFFSGGMMPSIDLPLYFQSSLKIEQQWLWDGTHYAKTAREWLNNTDKNKAEIINIFKNCYGSDNAQLWLQRWRIFFMACEELWNYDQGQEWMVAHYLFSK